MRTMLGRYNVLFKFIYRSYRYTYKQGLNGHLIPSFTISKFGLAVKKRWTCKIDTVPSEGSNPTMNKIFVIFGCSVFLAAGLAAFK